MIYAKLLRFRDDQLENYQGPLIEYSVSDYHHAPKKPIRRSSTRASNHGFNSRQMVSQYSILNENSQPQQSHGYQRQPSVAETERSYDPFRTSRNQMARGQADRAKITLLRGPSSSHEHRISKTSLNRRVMSKASVQHPAVARVQQAEVYSLESSSSRARNPTRTQASMKGRSVSPCSSRRSVSHNVVVRASTSYKRGVSFAQMRRPRNMLHQVRPVQENESPRSDVQERSKKEASPAPQSLWAADSPQSAVSTVIVRSRKSPAEDDEETPKRERPTSYYWKEDARQVSSELEKACDEAFNRYSAASTTITGIIDTPERHTSSPATSIGIHADRYASVDSGRMAGRSSLQDRPLPVPPAYEHLGSFTYQELAKTRALLQKRAADTSLAGHFDDIIAHLDRLMQPSTARLPEADRRTVSAPREKPDITHGLDEFEKLLSRGPFGLRSTSEPLSGSFTNPLSSQRYDLESRSRVRALAQSPDQKPISPTKPLTIKKKRSDLTDTSQQHRSTGNLIHEEPPNVLQKGDRRSAGLSLLESNLEPIQEDEKETRGSRDSKTFSGEGKKRGWFRRHDRARRSEDGDNGPPLPPKDHLSSQEHQYQEYPHTTSGGGDDRKKRASDVPSDESRTSEPKKPSGGRGMFFKIFGKRDSKESKNPTGRPSGGRLECLYCDSRMIQGR